MKKLLLAASVAVTAVVGTTSTTHADTPGCVTLTEYRAAKPDMRKRRVDHIFDTTGTRKPGTSKFVYKHCRPDRQVVVTYRWASFVDGQRMIVVSKMIVPVSSPTDDTPGCVTIEEMNLVDHPADGTDLHISEVHKIFGTTGWLTRSLTYDYKRQYEPCGQPPVPGKVVDVLYARQTYLGPDYASDVDWGYRLAPIG